MLKKILLLLFIFSLGLIFNIEKSYADDFNVEEQNQNQGEELQVQEQNTKKDIYDDDLYSREQMVEAYVFANHIKQAIQERNLVEFSKYVAYPIVLRTGSHNGYLIVRDQSRLMGLGTKRVLNDAFVYETCRDNELSTSQDGFTLGDNLGLTFKYINGAFKIYILTILK